MPQFEQEREAFLEAGFTVTELNEGTHWQIGAGSIVLDYWPSAQKAQAFARVFRVEPGRLIAAIKAGRIKMPDDASTSTCNACQAPIVWVKSVNTIHPNKGGKNTPLNPDGFSHFGTCTARKKKPKRAALKATRDFLETTAEVFNDPIGF